MGCDIHLHQEVNIDGRWEHYALRSPSRDYRLFGKMAGVRSDENEPIVAPRGLPADCTLLTTFDYLRMKGDAHTPSFLIGDELATLEDWYEKTYPKIYASDAFGYLFENSWGGFTKYPNDYKNDEFKKRILEVRFVFWFDN